MPRALLHSITIIAPVAILLLLEVLLRNPAALPWIVTMIGLIVSGATLLLVQPELNRLVARPLTGVGLLFSGLLLVISTPLLGFQQVRTVADIDAPESPMAWPWVVTTVLILVSSGVMIFTAKRLTQWSQVFTPIYVVAGGTLLVLVLEGQWFRQAVAAGIAVLVAVAFEDVYLAFHEPSKHHAYAPINIASTMGLVTYFLFSASLFWLMIFFDFPLWLAALMLAGICALLTYQALWALGFTFPRGFPYLFTLPVLTMELFWVVSFLPVSVYVSALVLTVGYYVASGFSRNHLLGSLNRRVSMRYLVTAAMCLAIVLATAKWR